MDWDTAEWHLKDVIDQYKSLIGVRGVNPMFGLSYLNTLMTRFLDGERTQELYDDMIDCE